MSAGTLYYPHGAALAETELYGIRMQVFALRGGVELLVLNMRIDDPTRPKGLRKFRPSKVKPPDLILCGRWEHDRDRAASWLTNMRFRVFEAETREESAA